MRNYISRLFLVSFILSSGPLNYSANHPVLASEILTSHPILSNADAVKTETDDATSRKTVSVRPSAAHPKRDVSGPGTVITLLLAGDTGFNQSRQRVLAKGVKKNGKFQTWEMTLSKFIKDITGDIKFVNVETVVTDNNSHSPRGKDERFSFFFRSHPNGFKFLAQSGFNLFSLANNHSLDFGRPGVQETLKHFGSLKSRYNIAYSGIGKNRAQAGAPSFIRVKDTDISFSAISFITSGAISLRAGRSTPGQLSYHRKADLDEITDRLSSSNSDFKILSIHYGRERHTRVSDEQKRKWRQQFIKTGDIDLVVAHHAHVAQGIELTDGKLIFYGLGNFLHHGMADMSSKGICRDYGTVARVYLLKDRSGTISVRAVEAIPVINMHTQTARISSVKASQLRIHALNYLSQSLTSVQENAEGIQFKPQRDGSGLYCRPGSQHDPAPISKLCLGWTTPPPVSQSVRQRLIRACTDRNWSRHKLPQQFKTSKSPKIKPYSKDTLSFTSFIQSE